MIMASSSKWSAFVRQFRVEKGSNVEITHTSIQSPAERLHVPTDRYDEFMREYALMRDSGTVPLHITEKPLDVSNIRVDFDYRYPINDDEPIARKYTIEDVERQVKVYCEEIKRISTIRMIDVYLMEKPSPIEYRNKMKDGIHMVIATPMCYENQHYIRSRVIERSDELFKDMGIVNSVDEIVDESVVSCTNWTLLGSGKPNLARYEVTHLYRYDTETGEMEDVEIDADMQSSLPKMMSVRRMGVEQIPIREEFTEELRRFASHVLPGLGVNRKSSVNQTFFRDKRNNNTKLRMCSPDDFELARKLTIECLNSSRADSYNEWIRVGWALFNIDHRLIDVWKEFSSRSSKYVETECEGKWMRFVPDEMGLASLIYWAKTDNPAKYKSLKEESLFEAIDKCATKDSNGSHWDVANAVFQCFRMKFAYCGSNNWYMFMPSKHRWVKTTEAGELRKQISTQLFVKFIDRAKYWQSKAMEEDGNELWDARAATLIEISKKLKDTNFKRNIVTEASSLFCDDDFMNKLDSNTYLVGCPNGVYDLRNHVFRKGEPSDMISFQTAVDYQPHDPTSEKFHLIRKTMESIFPDVEMREYVLNLVASSIDGCLNRQQEKMWFLTGSGSNGKSVLMELIRKTIGDYYGTAPVTLLTGRQANSNSASPEVFFLRGKRMIVTQEPGSGENSISTGTMKQLTGNDELFCRPLYMSPFTFYPQFNLFMTANDLPDMPSQDEGTWRRTNVVPFEVKFKEDPEPDNVLEQYADPELRKKLEECCEAFLAYIIHLHENLSIHSIKSEPQAVKTATKKYRAETNIVAQFALANLEEAPGEDLTEHAAWFHFKSVFGREVKITRNKFDAQLDLAIGGRNRGKWEGYRILY